MSERVILTFSGVNYFQPTKMTVENGPRLGATKVLVYDDVFVKDKHPEFIQKHQALFDKKCPKSGVNRGFGHFVWKPWINLDALSRVEENSVVCYCDGDTWPIADMTPLFEMADKYPIILFAACSHSQRHWSKFDTQEIMGMNHPFFRDRQAAVARFMLFRKGGRVNYAPAESPRVGKSITVEEFLNEWLFYTADIRINTFEKSVMGPEFEDMVEPRCEQAVLGNLAHKYSIPLHRECDQWGDKFKTDFPFDQYGQIFESTGSHSRCPSGKTCGSPFMNVGVK